MSRPPPSGNGEAGSTDGAGGPGNTGTVIAGNGDKGVVNIITAAIGPIGAQGAALGNAADATINGEATDGDPTTATCTVVGGSKGTVENCTTVR